MLLFMTPALPHLTHWKDSEMAQAPKKGNTMLDKMKAFVSSGSTAGKLRDADKRTSKALRDAGAKADTTSAKPKAKTRNA